MSDDAPLARLAHRAGILSGYRDALGTAHRITDDSKVALLRAMNIAADSPDAIDASLRILEEGPWRRVVEPVHLVKSSRATRPTIPVTLPAAGAQSVIAWRFEGEDGKRRQGEVRGSDLPVIDSRNVDGSVMERRALNLPFPVGFGYHRLVVLADGQGEKGEEGAPSTSLIVAPVRCYLPPRAAGEDLRLWGLTLQLYSLRSKRNWGIGDYADLDKVAGVVGPMGASAIGLNPLHAMFPHWPDHRSPYSPSHRQFLTIRYIAVESMADFAECEEARGMVASSDFQQRLQDLRATPLVDHVGVMAAKMPLFERLYQSFRERHLSDEQDERTRSFRAFQKDKGEALRRLGVFQALSERFRGENWRRWDEPYRDPTSAQVAAFAEEHRARVEFYQYLQWQAHLQVKAACETARDGGMSVGLYHDLALAPDSSGAEAWANQNLFARGASLGAPPDLWNHLGQNWGLPPYVPMALHDDAYRQLSGVIRSIMEHGGAMRVDHAIGLERMFWIPEGAGPADGAYVRYPVDELFGIIALESVREKSLIIGEDLGTLPEGFHKRMHSAAMLSYRLLYFSQNKRGDFTKPGRYPALATVAVTTHDLATFPGYWRARDLHLRDELKQFPSDEVKGESFKQRARDRRALIRALKREGLLPDSAAADGEPTFEMIEAAYRYIARTPSLLLLLSLEDVAEEEDQPNLPGTVNEHPNWQRKVAMDVDALAEDGRLRALVRAIMAERPHATLRAGAGKDSKS